MNIEFLGSEPTQKQPQGETVSLSPVPKTETDWFATINQDVQERLFNPKLRTPHSQRIWEELPVLLQQHADLLEEEIGTASFSVHLHGSTAIGIATEEDIHEDSQDIFTGESIPQSDIDLLILVDGQEPTDIDQEHEMSTKIFEGSEFTKKLGARGDAIFINLDKLAQDIKDVDSHMEEKSDWHPNALFACYDLATALSSPLIFEPKKGVDAALHNKLLRALLALDHRETIWNAARAIFNTYHVNYEDNGLRGDPFGTHKKRVAKALGQILKQRDRASSFLKGQRGTVNLPTFEDLESLNPHLRADTQSTEV